MLIDEFSFLRILLYLSQPAITCSKLTIETLEQGVKYTNGVVLVSLLLTLNIFHTFSSVSIVNFEQVNAGWDAFDSLQIALIYKPLIL